MAHITSALTSRFANKLHVKINIQPSPIRFGKPLVLFNKILAITHMVLQHGSGVTSAFNISWPPTMYNSPGTIIP